MSMKRGMWEQELPQAPEDVHERMLKTLADLDKQTTVASVEKGGNLMKKNNGERKNMVKWAVAAAASLVICVTAGAAGYFRWNEQAAKTFGNPSEEWQEQTIKSGIAEPQSASVSADGITITAVQSIRDTGRIYLLFRVTADDDKIDWEEGFRSFEVTTVDGEALNGDDMDAAYNYGYNAGFDNSSDFDAPERKDGYYFIDLTSEDPERAWNGDKMAVTFHGFQYYTFGPDGKEGMELADSGVHIWKGLREIDGSWRLEIPIGQAENRKQAFAIHRDVEICGFPVEIKEVRISPLWLEIVYDRKDVEHLQKTVGGAAEYYVDGLWPRILLDREGNLLMEDTCVGGPVETDNPDEMVYRIATGSVVDVDKVSAVILGGQQPTIVPLAEESELAEGEMQRYQDTLDRLLEEYR